MGTRPESPACGSLGQQATPGGLGLGRAGSDLGNSSGWKLEGGLGIHPGLQWLDFGYFVVKEGSRQLLRLNYSGCTLLMHTGTLEADHTMTWFEGEGLWLEF